MKEIKKLYIVGAGGFGREVLWLVERINKIDKQWDVCGFIDDNESIIGSVINECKVVGGCNYFDSVNEMVYVVVAIGNVITKKKIIDKLLEYKYVRLAMLIDPNVQMSEYVTVGEGSIICAGSILTTNIQIGNNVIINLDCTVGHDVVIEDYVTVYPSANISGNVVIGQMSEIGTGCRIIQGKNICDNVIIGAGATVVRDIFEPGTYVGSPAKQIKKYLLMKSGGALNI